MGQIRAGERKVFDEFEQFVLDHCGHVSDQEACLKALREFVGEGIPQALADRADLVKASNVLTDELNKAKRQVANLVESAKRDGERLIEAERRIATAEAGNPTEQPAPPPVPPGTEPKPDDPPGGHGDPAAPPSVRSHHKKK